MTLDVLIKHQKGDFLINAAFKSEHKITALFGASGAGKTSILSVIAGITKPQSAKIAIEGKTLVDTSQKIFIAPHLRKIGWVFQEGRLFPHLSVKNNLLFGDFFTRSEEKFEKFDHIIELLGLGNLLSRQPENLSGGEKQRVAIGRALMAHPRLLLLDEPLAALDEARKTEILPYIEKLRDELAIPMVYVSHSANEVKRLAAKVILLEQGQVIAEGEPCQVLK